MLDSLITDLPAEDPRARAERILAWAKRVCLGEPGIPTAPQVSLRLDGYNTLVAEIDGQQESYSVQLLALSHRHGQAQAARQFRAELALLEDHARREQE